MPANSENKQIKITKNNDFMIWRIVSYIIIKHNDLFFY